jgi:hypothetical protein
MFPNSVLLDSLAMLRRGGRSCLAGSLGGLAPVPDFNPLLQMSSGVHFSFFGSFVFGTPGFPLSDLPLQQIAADAASTADQPLPVKQAGSSGFGVGVATQLAAASRVARRYVRRRGMTAFRASRRRVELRLWVRERQYRRHRFHSRRGM